MIGQDDDKSKGYSTPSSPVVVPMSTNEKPENFDIPQDVDSWDLMEIVTTQSKLEGASEHTQDKHEKDKNGNVLGSLVKHPQGRLVHSRDSLSSSVSPDTDLITQDMGIALQEAKIAAWMLRYKLRREQVVDVIARLNTQQWFKNLPQQLIDIYVEEELAQISRNISFHFVPVEIQGVMIDHSYRLIMRGIRYAIEEDESPSLVVLKRNHFMDQQDFYSFLQLVSPFQTTKVEATPGSKGVYYLSGDLEPVSELSYVSKDLQGIVNMFDRYYNKKLEFSVKPSSHGKKDEKLVLVITTQLPSKIGEFIEIQGRTLAKEHVTIYLQNLPIYNAMLEELRQRSASESDKLQFFLVYGKVEYKEDEHNYDYNLYASFIFKLSKEEIQQLSVFLPSKNETTPNAD